MALPKLKSALSAAAGAALIITPLTAGQAQEARMQPVVTTSVDQIKIPMSDARGIQTRGVQMSAAMASEGAQVIVYYGDSPATLEAAKHGARLAIADGVPLRGLMLADPLTPERVGGSQISGSNQVVFYADGILTGTIDNADRSPETLPDMVRSELKRGQGVLQANLGQDNRQVAINTATPN